MPSPPEMLGSAASASASAARAAVVRLFPNIYFLGYRAGQLSGRLVHQGLPDPTEVADFVLNFPLLYRTWWWNLVTDDPVHVMVETTLILSIVIILLRTRRSADDWKKENKLSPEEEEELLMEWKNTTRAPLTPSTVEDYVEDHVVVLKCGKHMSVRRHTMEGETEMLDDVLNMATLDFLGMGGSPEVKEAADAALDRYGCGSCGPRGFYGTVDVHLRLEERMAEFWGTEGAILYSDGASTVSSTIAAFCKRGDLLVVDDAVSEPLVTGVALSRAHVKWFAHNDMADLRRVLGQVSAKDAQLGRPANAQRRFLVAEGLYRNTGTICPLDELVRLKEEFAFRLILDESLAAGVLGPTGRGVTELYGLKPMRHVEITTIGLEAALGSIGGVTVGTEEVVEHQRLSGSGYCFSASAPPFTAVAAMTSLQMLKDNPDDYLQRIGDNVVYMYEKLKAWCEERRGLLAVRSDERSPVVVLQVADCPETECLDEGVFFGEVARECLDRGVAVCVGGRGQQTASPKSSRPAPTPPSLRMALTATHSHADIDRALSVLAEAVDEVMDQFLEEAKQA